MLTVVLTWSTRFLDQHDLPFLPRPMECRRFHLPLPYCELHGRPQVQRTALVTLLPSIVVTPANEVQIHYDGSLHKTLLVF